MQTITGNKNFVILLKFYGNSIKFCDFFNEITKFFLLFYNHLILWGNYTKI